MTGKRIFKVIFALVVVAVIAFGSLAIYRLGFAHGAMTNITLPEGSESLGEAFGRMPYRHMPLGWHYGPRVGFLGMFPFLCFGGFFFLMLMFGFGFMARKRAWMHHYGPGSHPSHWKHEGTPPRGPGCPPWEQKQPEADPDTPTAETDSTKE